MAAGLELAGADTLDDPTEALPPRRRGRAASGARSPAPYGIARNRLVFARIAGGDEGRDAAVEAERIFRSLGARGPAADAAEIVEAIDRGRAAAAPDPVARPVPGGPRRARPCRRPRGSRRRPATC